LLCLAGTVALVLVYQENLLGARIFEYVFYAWIGFMFLGVFLRTESS
jgi:hypothetical protein